MDGRKQRLFSPQHDMPNMRKREGETIQDALAPFLQIVHARKKKKEEKQKKKKGWYSEKKNSK